MSIYNELAKKLLHGQQVSVNAGQFNCEEAYKALDKITTGWETETDGRNDYDDDDKMLSAIGTLEYFYTEEEAISILNKA